MSPTVDPFYRPFLPGARLAGCTCFLELASTSGSSLRAALADMFSACPRQVRVYIAQRSESLRSRRSFVERGGTRIGYSQSEFVWAHRLLASFAIAHRLARRLIGLSLAHRPLASYRSVAHRLRALRARWRIGLGSWVLVRVLRARGCCRVRKAAAAVTISPASAAAPRHTPPRRGRWRRRCARSARPGRWCRCRAPCPRP